MKLNKFFLVPLLLVVAIIVVGFYLYGKNGSNKKNEPTPVVENSKTPLDRLPDFFIAEVSSVNNDSFVVDLGGQKREVLVVSSTELIQQVKNPSGAGFQNIPASVEDIKAGSRVVVFYVMSSDVYTANKVQILNF